jgi:hypothetical protein
MARASVKAYVTAWLGVDRRWSFLRPFPFCVLWVLIGFSSAFCSPHPRPLPRWSLAWRRSLPVLASPSAREHHRREREARRRHLGKTPDRAPGFSRTRVVPRAVLRRRDCLISLEHDEEPPGPIADQVVTGGGRSRRGGPVEGRGARQRGLRRDWGPMLVFTSIAAPETGVRYGDRSSPARCSAVSAPSRVRSLAPSP